MIDLENVRIAGTWAEYLAALRIKTQASIRWQSAKDALAAYCASKGEQRR